MPAAKQREYLLSGNEEFPESSEAAKVIWKAVNDGKDQIDYPTDSVCEKLYNQYMSMHKEEFKKYFYNKIFL